MTFTGNKLFSNIQYGFDPHDFTHDVLVENNESYDNGSHGFIISRGCSNFVFRNNVSHDNKVKPGSKNPSAHAFMLDPGADPAKAGVPQAPSTNNLIEHNIAYGNDGYGVRVFGSTSNTIRNNLFSNNRTGITLEYGSTGNTLEGNTIQDSTGESVTEATSATSLKGGYGVYAFGGSDGNTIIGNTITGNSNIGVYLKTANNLVQDNVISSNSSDGIGTLLETSDELPPDPPAASTTNSVQALSDALTPGAYSNDQEPGVWSLANATTPSNNTISGNTVQHNQGVGLSLKGSKGPLVEHNTVTANLQDGIYLANGTTTAQVRTNTVTDNQGYGIKLNGSDVQGNWLSLNTVTNNSTGGIAVTNGANNTVTMPAKMHFATVPPSTMVAAGSITLTGTTTPGATVEVFSDTNKQAAFYEGIVQADSTGTFTFTTNGPPQGTDVTAMATDATNSTSALSKPAKAPGEPDAYVVYLPIITK